MVSNLFASVKGMRKLCHFIPGTFIKTLQLRSKSMSFDREKLREELIRDVGLGASPGWLSAAGRRSRWCRFILRFWRANSRRWAASEFRGAAASSDPGGAAAVSSSALIRQRRSTRKFTANDRRKTLNSRVPSQGLEEVAATTQEANLGRKAYTLEAPRWGTCAIFARRGNETSRWSWMFLLHLTCFFKGF